MGVRGTSVSFLPPLGLSLRRLYGRSLVCLHTELTRTFILLTSPVKTPRRGKQKALSPLWKIQSREYQRLPPRSPQKEPLVWPGTSSPASCVAVKTLVLVARKAVRQGPSLGQLGFIPRSTAQLAQNSFPDARTYFILFCFPTCTHTHK